ncbi:nuclear hormone receptor HR96-like [Oppia nitens]|uniref:nuclear hormone receptor HR96-like n=1 Tax=Oppia nitens TaxID=1686743 RepID=UPI0023DCDBF9|nr:nuclear hormone receptor HR96-like [Oppia nitens]
MGMKKQLVFKKKKLIDNNDMTDLDINTNESTVSDDDWYEFTKWLDNNNNNNSQNRETVSEKLDQIEKRSQILNSVFIIPEPMVDYEGLNQLQIKRISELLIATSVYRHPVSKNIVRLNSKQDIMRLSQQRIEESIREIVFYVKRVQPYRQLCADDQWQLVKHGSLDQMIIKMIYYFDSDVNNFIFYIDNNTSLMVITDVTYWSTTGHRIDNQLAKLFTKLITNMLIQCRSDPIIIALLSAIVLFNPNLPDLKHRHVIKLEQQLYIYLLQRYLQLKYRSDYQWMTRLQIIMSSLMDLPTVRELQKRIEYTDYQQYMSYYGPLVREVYNF